MPPLCEVRVPTYRRPAWLRRALESLRAQSHTDWHAVVLDDSPDREGAAVVEELGDERIIYRPNATRLGAAGNIDQSFTPEPLAGGEYASILEDDAALQPDCLRDNLRALEEAGVDLLLRNQAIYEDGPTGWRDTGETTRGAWLNAGPHAPLDLHALLFFMEGVSNGGLFWRNGRGIDLRVGAAVTDAGLQECCRTLLVQREWLFAAEPLVIFTQLPASQIERTVTANRVFARGTQALRQHVLRVHGDAVIAAAEAIAHRTGREAALAQALLEIGHHTSALGLSHTLSTFTKGLLRKLLVSNPVAGFLPARPHSAP